LGAVLTAPLVGWPHAFPGLLMNAPEKLREVVGVAMVLPGMVSVPVALWRLGLKRAWPGASDSNR
jgi:hypothetical protein